VGLGLVVVAALVVAFWPRPVPVDLQTVARGPLEVVARHQGKTRVRERYVISMPVAGHVQRVDLEPGDAVVEGETILAVIEPGAPLPLDSRARAEAAAAVDAAQAALREARAQRERAEADKELAEAELVRIEPLSEEGVVSRQELDRARTRARSARKALTAADAAWRRARFELQQARAALIPPSGDSEGTQDAPETVRIPSPIDGIVLTRHQESQAVLPAGAPLLEIGDPSRIEIVADFLSTDAVTFRPGMRAMIEDWGGDRALNAVVRRVEPFGFMKVSALGVEEQRVNVVLDFEEPVEGLADGYRVEVGVVTWEADNVLRVPASALFRDEQGRWAVYRVTDGRAERRGVTIDHHSGRHAEVVDGLAEGDPVIAYPSEKIQEGQRVERRKGS
jgi:HlyD family secretion protein